MTRVSTKGYYERMESIALRDTRPLSAGYCWTLVDNIGHLVDESYKYRLNFVHGGDANSDFFYDNNGEQYGFEFYFQTHMPFPDRYPRYDVRVALYGNDGTNEVRASITTPSTTWPITGMTRGVIGTATSTIPSGGTTTWVIDDSFAATSTENAPVSMVPCPAYPGEEVFVGRQALVKLIVEWPIDVTEGGPNAAIRGIQVREYPE